MRKRYFGTDGIRGTVNQNKINGDMFFKFGLAAGTYFRNLKKKKQNEIIGKKTKLGISFGSINRTNLFNKNSPSTLFLEPRISYIFSLERSYKLFTSKPELSIGLQISRKPSNDFIYPITRDYLYCNER